MLSTLLTEFPGFMSTIRLIRDDREEALKRLVEAEHTPPNRYARIRETFLDILRGRLSWEKAYRDSKLLPDRIERNLANQIFRAAKYFLEDESSAPIVELSAMEANLPNGKNLNVSHVYIRNYRPPRTMFLYLWEEDLSELQLRVASSLLHRALKKHYGKHANLELDFISVSRPEFSSGRRLKPLGWDQLRPFQGEELDAVLSKYLCDLLDEYHRRGPRMIRPKRGVDLFSR